MSKSLGYQVAVDFYGCSSEQINSCRFIEESLLKAAKIMSLSVVTTTIHEFSPIGVSGVIVIEESHIAIHTWPEHNYVAIDFFTCNQSYNLKEGIDWLANVFSAQKITQTEGRRGDISEIQKYTLAKHAY